MATRLISASSLRCFRACPRLYQYKYVMGYRPTVQAESLRIGSLLHKGLEGWWLAAKDGVDVDLRLTAAEQAIRQNSNDDYDIARVNALMAGYHYRWSGVAMTVIGVEVEYMVDLQNPATGASSRTFRHAGKIDAIAEINGERWVIEHKSSSSDITAGSFYWQQLRLDNQVSQYILAANLMGQDVVGCIYDVVKKPGLRPGKATPVESRRYTKNGKLDARQRLEDETPQAFSLRIIDEIAENPDKYYQRGQITLLEGDTEESSFDMWQTARTIRDSELAGRWPRNPASCMAYNRECEFFPCCTGAGSLDNPVNFRRKEKYHQELSIEESTTP